MIAKGTLHSNGARLGAYMVTGKDGEQAELHELRGFADDDIVAAFRSEHVVARGTQCDKPFFHCQVRNPAGENLTREQWVKVADRFEKKLGLSGQPRAIAFHSKDGDAHMHIAWSRIDPETMTAKALPFFKLRLKEACRQLEEEFSLTKVRNHREAGEPRAAHRAERDQAQRLGVDIEATRLAIRQAWTHSDSGGAFVAALSEHGMTLCRGDRRDFIVMDGEGGIHALGKRLVDATAADIRARLVDLQRADLPTLESARAGLEHQPRPLALEKLDAEERRLRGHRATTTDDGGLVAQQAEANRRHLELNPSLKGSRLSRPAAPADIQAAAQETLSAAAEKQKRVDDRAKEIAARLQKAQDRGRDR